MSSINKIDAGTQEQIRHRLWSSHASDVEYKQNMCRGNMVEKNKGINKPVNIMISFHADGRMNQVDKDKQSC